MTSERWQQVKEIFQATIELAPPNRAAYLIEACAGDLTLQTEVESLISAHDEPGSFLDRPVVDLAMEPAANLVGQTLGHYQILALLGRGGMGEVYRAKDTTLGRVVAIKVLPPCCSIDRDRLHRFEQEARAASALNHPNIITIHEFGQEGSVHFIVSELIEGETVRQRMARDRLTPNAVLETAIQIAEALNAAHEAGIVHRDIKPENVMVRPDGLVKILDFGLAKLTEESEEDRETGKKGEFPSLSGATTLPLTFSGVVMGTVSYMSPEQARGQKLDARSDLFSLGVVLYEMAAGRSPFSRPTSADVIAAILNQEPEALTRQDAPAELAQIIGRALRKERAERYQLATDLLADLKDLKHRLAFGAEQERTLARSGRNDQEPVQINAGFTGNLIGRRKVRAVAAACIAFVLLIGLTRLTGLTWLAWHAWMAWGVDSTQTTITSIAVLPFANETGDAGMEYLSDGISECLIDKLARLPQLKVIAHTSSSRYRDRNADLREVARALGVQALVVGRVVRRGDHLLINSELVDGRERVRMWGGMYRRSTEDLQMIQSEIARDIAGELRIRLTHAEEQQLATNPTTNPRAYDLLLKGRASRYRGGTESLEKAADYFQQAIASDPNYALAYAEMADSYRYLACNGLRDPREMLPKARAAAERALDLDERLAEAHIAMAGIKITDWDWAGAERSFNRSFELTPNSAGAHYGYAHLLSILGRHDQAIEEVKRARELDPITPPFNKQLGQILRKELDPASPGRGKQVGFILWSARQYDQALQAIKHNIERDPTFPCNYIYLGYVYSGQGKYLDAISAYTEAQKLEDNSTSTRCYLGYALAMAGRRNQALAVLKQLQVTQEYVSPAELAILYLGLGEKEQALRSLEKSYAAHDLQLQYLNADPHFDSLRTDAQFQNLVLRVGLSPLGR